MKSYRTILAGLILFLVLASQVNGINAQEDDAEACTELVAQAYEITKEACEAAGRDEACYGNIELEAQPAGINFDETGDIVGVGDIEAIRLSEMNAEAGVWGIAMMRIQATLPEDDTTQYVQIILFGNVEMENLAANGEAIQAPPPTFELTANAQILVQSEPASNAARVTFLNRGDTVIADGKNEAGDWYHVIVTVEGEDAPLLGWVSGTHVTLEEGADPAAMAVITETGESVAPAAAKAEAVSYGPMQAFTFRVGAEDAPCEAAPNSGILIQTPEGAGQISFLINEVVVEVGSTVYIEAVPGDVMTTSVLEGRINAQVGDESRLTPEGAEVKIDLNANGTATLISEPVRGYDPTPLEQLPLELLDREIEIAPPWDGLPLPGTWNFTTEGAACPSGTTISSANVDINLQPTENGFVADGTLLEMERGDDNIYQYTTPITGSASGTVDHTWRVLALNVIEGEQVWQFTSEACTVTVPFRMTLVSELPQ